MIFSINLVQKKNNMRTITIAALLVITCNSSAQSGYLGALNGIEIKTSFVPSIRKTHTLNDSETEAKVRRRLAYSSFSINYSRILSKKVEVGVGYTLNFSSMHTQTSFYEVRDSIVSGNQVFFATERLNFIKDPTLLLHQLNLDLKYYRLGSLSPIGKYIGFGFRYGFGKMDSSDPIKIGKRDAPSKENFLSSKHELLRVDDIYPSSDVNLSMLVLNAQIGRNYPITKQLVFSIGLTFPLITYLKNGQGPGGDFAFTVKDTPRIYDDGATLSHMGLLSLKKRSRISIDFGLKFHL